MRAWSARVIAVLALSVAAYATDLELAPRATTAVTLKGKKVSFEYGQVALKGRSVDALLDRLGESRIWRAGIDQATTFTTETAVEVGGQKVRAGKYTVYVCAPKTGPFSFILNSDPGIELGELAKIEGWVASDSQAKLLWAHMEPRGYANIVGKEVLRVPMTVGRVDPPSELFGIALKGKADGAEATLSWADRSWSVEMHPAN